MYVKLTSCEGIILYPCDRETALLDIYVQRYRFCQIENHFQIPISMVNVIYENLPWRLCVWTKQLQFVLRPTICLLIYIIFIMYKVKILMICLDNVWCWYSGYRYIMYFLHRYTISSNQPKIKCHRLISDAFSF